MNFETLSAEEIATKLETDLTNGLKSREVIERLKRDGKNEFPPQRTRPWYFIFLLSLIGPLQIILLLAAIISVLAPRLGKWNEPLKGSDFIDFSVILFIVILDAILETIQTLKARQAVAALRAFVVSTTIVIRNGRQQEIPSSDLVVGDLVVLEAGQKVPADLRLVESVDCYLDESSLTGESIPVKKNHTSQKATKILANLRNFAFMGTAIIAGRAMGIVIMTGEKTQIGKINHGLARQKNILTPLEKKIKKFSYWIAIFSFVVALIMFMALYFSGEKAHWSNYLMVAITLAIGIIPESLPAVISITLALATKRMAHQNVIVKKLAAVETLGGVNIICTDKTGTLTQNKMTVKKILWNNRFWGQKEFIGLPITIQKELFIKSLILPNNAITESEDRLGDPTELALIDFAEFMNYDEKIAREQWPRCGEIPFDSQRKLMTTINKIDGKKYIFTKGAIDQLLKICNFQIIDGEIIPFPAKAKKHVLEEMRKFSDEALRVLGFAYQKQAPQDGNNTEQNLIFLGAVGMIDPVRPEAIKAVNEAQESGIQVVMITGDHVDTALAIARDLGLANTKNEVISAEDLDSIPDHDLLKIIDNIKVFARVNPEHKVRIVNLLQKKGYLVAMTGDGVNDAPSLVKAEIGVAMGKGGTDVAKEAADVILTDDNLITIMKGVVEGRNVYQKIRQTLVLLISFNLANVLAIFILSLIYKNSPLKAVNILYLNLIVESCLAIAIGLGPLDESLILLQPQVQQRRLLTGLFYPIFKITTFLVISALLANYVGLSIWPEESETNVLLFITLSFAPLFFVHLIKLTNWKASTKIPWLISKPLIFASLIAAIINLMVIFVPTINDKIFYLKGYGENGWNSNNWWAFFVGLGFAILPSLGIIIINIIVFFSYHYAPPSWQRNHRLVNQMVREDQILAKKHLKKRHQTKKKEF